MSAVSLLRCLSSVFLRQSSSDVSSLDVGLCQRCLFLGDGSGVSPVGVAEVMCGSQQGWCSSDAAGLMQSAAVCDSRLVAETSAWMGFEKVRWVVCWWSSYIALVREVSSRLPFRHLNGWVDGGGDSRSNNGRFNSIPSPYLLQPNQSTGKASPWVSTSRPPTSYLWKKK